jgi:glutamyl-Q tRNA(Asp) synthetase
MDVSPSPRLKTAPPYRGRFAPSPTGQLHQGSLVAALASWLDARAQGGTWIIRMEDLDGPRCVDGADAAILATLERFGLASDEPVLYQSTRTAAYAQALRQLQDTGHAYRCTCSRSEEPGVYSGHCRDRGLQDGPCAWRLRLPADAVFEFRDGVQGPCRLTAAALGDPVIYRRDGLTAYQLAVVVDDAAQGITHVVRGADLQDSTGWQIAVAAALQVKVPSYSHIPLVSEPDGTKLSKSRRSVPVSGENVASQLFGALALLGIHPPEALKAARVSDIMGWAVGDWQPGRLREIQAMRLPCFP